jgi:hypothetical protein
VIYGIRWRWIIDNVAHHGTETRFHLPCQGLNTGREYLKYRIDGV